METVFVGNIGVSEEFYLQVYLFYQVHIVKISMES